MSTYQLEIDGSGAESGAQRIVKSFDDIKAAADRMEGGVSEAAKKASSSFADLQKNAKPVSEAAINSIKALSSAFSSFKAPSDAAVRNAIIFLQGIKSVGALNIGRVSGLSSLLAAISGYRGPSPTSGKNTLALLNALRFASTYSTPRGLAGTLNALSAFKGPSAAAARNVTSLLTALNNFKAGPGMAATVRALEKIVAAANAARASMNSLKGAGPSAVNIKVPSGASRGFADLIKQQGFLQTALLRTQTAWNALGGILAAKAIIGASNDLIKIRAQLEAATGSATKAGWAFEFLRGFSEKMGLEFRTAAQSFGFFLGSVKGTNLTLDESRQIFEGFSTAARALQLSTEDVDGVFRALGQMMSKGKIQAEELRGQLGDRLPGAFVRFAVALKMTKPGELDQALKKGAVSGEKMKQAIIDVANALQVEFAGSADKMSKTVDAAFNRLKNAFTFASGDLGKSGLNQALISIMDTATKFLQSNSFNTFMSGLGVVFKFVGDHVEAFANILGTLALSSTLKWIASLVGVTAAATPAAVATTEVAAAATAEAAATTEAAVATTLLGGAWTKLNLIMKANIFLLIASAIVAVMMALKSTTDAMNENSKALDAVNAKMPDAANFSDAYAARLLNLADSANQVTASLQDMISKMNEAALRASQEDLKGIDTYKRVGQIAGYGINIRSSEGKFVRGPSGFFTKDDQDLLNRVVYRSPTGGVALRGGIPQSKHEFEQLGAAMAMVDTRATGPNGDNWSPIQSALHGRFNALLSQSRQKGYKGLPYSQWAEEIVPGYNKPTGGISGGAPASTTKKSHKKTAAEKAQDDINSAIDQAMNGLTDLETRAASTAESVGKLLSGSFDKAGAAAHIAAVEQEKSFEDQIKGPENKIKGVIQLAQQLGLDTSGKTITEQYQHAKDAIIAYAEQRQKTAAETKQDEKVATDIIALHQDNQIQQDAIGQLKQRGKSTAEVNRYIEIETALIGTSAEKHEELYRKLKAELEQRDALKIQMEEVNQQRALENKLMVDNQLRPLYQSGAKQEDIDYWREILEYTQQWADAGADPATLQNLVNIKAATLNEDRAMKQLADRYEATQQTAADMADAIVGGFRDGLEAGDSFLDMFKNIFKQISKIIMDFVLYNPLKQWLTQTIAQTLAPNATAGVGTPMQGTVSSYSTGGGLPGAVNQAINMFGGVGTGYQPGAGGYFIDVNPRNAPAGSHATFDSQGYIVPNRSSTDVVVTGTRASQPTAQLSPMVVPPPNKQVSFFSNFMQTMKASQAGFKSFTNMLKGGKITGAGIEGAIGAAGTAFAMYQTGNMLGKSIAKALGGGFRTQAVVGGITGGAAAGYSLAGPVGAAVGAVVGGVLGFLKKKPLIPSSYGSVTVGANGVATVGTTGTHGNADPKIGKQMAQAGAQLFNDFATNYGGYLAPGNYGTFGKREFDPAGPGNKGQYAFWSALGINNNGKPAGVEGKDWIYGSDSEVQAFALLKQIREGMIKGLSDTIMTVAKNTKATTMEGLQSDLGVGQAFDEFIKGSYVLTDVASKVSDLNQAFNKLKAQATALGLSEDKLSKARDRMMKNLKDDFNYQINQGILSYTNPAMAAYNDLVKEYHDAVETAMSVGGDLNAVEDLYGRKRADIVKQWADTATNGLVSAARDLYNQLTATTASPLNAGTILSNSRDLYNSLATQLGSGDFSNVDKLDTYAQNYLDAARQMYGSSTDYFDIFKTVTDQLNLWQSGGGVPGSTTSPTEIPGLPSLDSMVQEINTQSLEMIDAMGVVGQAVVEGSTNIVDAINNLAIALGYRAPTTTTPTTTPTGPTSGGTGVNSTGGTSGSSVTSVSDSGGVTSSTGGGSASDLNSTTNRTGSFRTILQ